MSAQDAEYVRCERHGLDVPKVTKDEAERLGLPFGCPVHLAEMKQAPDPADMTGDERAEEVTKHLCSPMFVPMDLIHQRIEALVGRPVWTHEMAAADRLAEEARTWQHPVDLEAHVIGSLDQMAGNKPVIIARVAEHNDGSMAPCGHFDTDPQDPAASLGELSHPTQDRAAPSTHNDGSVSPQPHP